MFFFIWIKEKDQDNVHQILNNIFKNRGRSKRKIKLNYKHIDSLNSLILGSQSNENSDSDFSADDEKTCEGESSSRTIHKKEKRRKLSTQMKKRPPSKSHNFDGKLFPDRNGQFRFRFQVSSVLEFGLLFDCLESTCSLSCLEIALNHSVFLFFSIF